MMYRTMRGRVFNYDEMIRTVPKQPVYVGERPSKEEKTEKKVVEKKVNAVSLTNRKLKEFAQGRKMKANETPVASAEEKDDGERKKESSERSSSSRSRRKKEESEE